MLMIPITMPTRTTIPNVRNVTQSNVRMACVSANVPSADVMNVTMPFFSYRCR